MCWARVYVKSVHPVESILNRVVAGKDAGCVGDVLLRGEVRWGEKAVLRASSELPDPAWQASSPQATW